MRNLVPLLGTFVYIIFQNWQLFFSCVISPILPFPHRSLCQFNQPVVAHFAVVRESDGDTTYGLPFRFFHIIHFDNLSFNQPVFAHFAIARESNGIMTYGLPFRCFHIFHFVNLTNLTSPILP